MSYMKSMKDQQKSKKKVSKHKNFIWWTILKERAETGRIYIMNIDHTNTHSSLKIN